MQHLYRVQIRPRRPRPRSAARSPLHAFKYSERYDGRTRTGTDADGQSEQQNGKFTWKERGAAQRPPAESKSLTKSHGGRWPSLLQQRQHRRRRLRNGEFFRFRDLATVAVRHARRNVRSAPVFQWASGGGPPFLQGCPLNPFPRTEQETRVSVAKCFLVECIARYD